MYFYHMLMLLYVNVHLSLCMCVCVEPRGDQTEAPARLNTGAEPGWFCAHGRPQDHRRHALTAQAGAGLRERGHQPAAGRALRLPGRGERTLPPPPKAMPWPNIEALKHKARGFCVLKKKPQIKTISRFDCATLSVSLSMSQWSIMDVEDVVRVARMPRPRSIWLQGQVLLHKAGALCSENKCKGRVVATL